jgi:predicted small metal-binding protein
MATEKRYYIDCREYPSANNCGLMISGKKEEVLETAVQHAIARHGHEDNPGLREKLASLLKEEKSKAS